MFEIALLYFRRVKMACTYLCVLIHFLDLADSM